MSKMRLDVACAKQAGTRAKAQDLIKEGKVKVNGHIVHKVSTPVEITDIIEIMEHDQYVSRGAYKLKGCLDMLNIRLDHQTVLDIGASTGGFTQVCLERGASCVYALDVGHLQLDPQLEKDHRVIKMEGYNARHIKKDWFEKTIDFLCMDVSFISSKTILEAVFDVLTPRHCAILIKPQFECGPAYLNSKGVLKNKKIEEHIVHDIEQFISQWYAEVESMPSMIKGRNGNQEYMLYAKERRR